MQDRDKDNTQVSATTMTPEDSQRLEACLQEAAEILYRNTPGEELKNFESLEKVVRRKMLVAQARNNPPAVLCRSLADRLIISV